MAKARIPKLSLTDTPRGGKKRAQQPPVRLPFTLKMEKVSFGEKIEQPRARDLDINPPNPLEWARRFRRLRGTQFSLENHRPLEQIYHDDHPHKVIIKPAQVGISEMALTLTMHALDVGASFWNTGQEGLNVAYLFPTQAALHDFSKERFAKIRREHLHLKEMFTNYDDVTFKQAGASFLYLRGAWSETALLSFPADLLILDEFDRMDEKAIALARQRLRASNVKREIDISTPTIPDTGIHRMYLQSDQHVWEVACTWCGDYTELDFARDVRLDNEPMDVWEQWEEERVRAAQITVHCGLCAQPIDPTGPGHWRAKEPGRVGIRGYWIPPLAFPGISIRQLCVDAVSQDTFVQTEFYRSGLGVPYAAHGSRITREMLASLSLEMPSVLRTVWTQTSMGVDVGKYFHYRISSTGPDKKRYVRAMGKVTSFEELDELMKRYRVRKCVIDALPENHGTQKWAEKYAGRVLRAFYPEGLKDQLYTIPGSKEEVEHLKGRTRARLRPGRAKDNPRYTIKINRTMAMDKVYDAVATNAELWPREIHDTREVIAQMMAPVRVSTQDDHGQEIAQWHHTSPDHFYHACVYDMIAQQLAPRGLPGILGQAVTGGWNPS